MPFTAVSDETVAIEPTTVLLARDLLEYQVTALATKRTTVWTADVPHPTGDLHYETRWSWLHLSPAVGDALVPPHYPAAAADGTELPEKDTEVTSVKLSICPQLVQHLPGRWAAVGGATVADAECLMLKPSY